MFDFHRQLPIPPGYRDVCVIDLESRSELDLPKVGLAKYCRNKTTAITMVSWRWASQPPGTTRLWSMEYGGGPDELIAALRDPDVLLMAFNVGFERDMFRHVWGIDTPWSRWRDRQTSCSRGSPTSHRTV